MFTPESIKKFINYSHTFSLSSSISSEKKKNQCTCIYIQKKPIPKLKESKKPAIRFANKAQILTFKTIPTFDFWDGYKYESDLTYFEQAFIDLTEIGHGSFGIVYAATYRGDGKRYAVKKMHFPYVGVINRELMQREVLIHEKFFDSPGITKFFGSWEEEDRLYLMLELCSYNLRDIKYCPVCINTQQLSVIAKDLLTGLKSLHEKNVMHFDVKPENILVTHDGHFKLADFGVALMLSVDDLSDVDEGDGKYLAMEVLNNPPTPAADIFSLGMTLLEIAARVELPSYGSGLQNIRQGLVNPQWLNSIEDPKLRALILWMIEPNPEKRPTAEMALATFEKRKFRSFLPSNAQVIIMLIFLSFVLSGIVFLH